MPVSAGCNPAAKVVQTFRAGSNRKSAARMPLSVARRPIKLCRSRHCAVSRLDSQILFRDANQHTGDKMAVQMTKSQLIEKIAAETEVAKKDVKGVLETLATVGYKELKKAGVFLVPGFAKFVVIKKPATKARQGTNPFNGEPMTFKAKPARKIVRARPVKAAKDAV
jgi:DNA-binding protein HU-beta